ncbi:MAG: hypothetical protein BroJett021_15340 [Chloroflexota bacterium]|nr:DUF4203 domain-containing protein [Caldilinea sp.]GIK72546.1 MAG: hypothetical protein BroJett021_15340 [Chloroflexota bacterium]
MFQILFGALFALFVGAAFALWGYRIFLVLLPIWGFFAGFWLGAHGITLLFGEGFLATTTGWMVGLVVGFFLAIFSYLFYGLGVAFVAGSIGYAIGSGMMAAMGLTAGWLLFIVGASVAVMVILLTLLFNLQKYVIITLTAIGGANAILLGVLLLLNRVTLTGLSGAGNAIQPVLADSWFWSIAWAVIAALGIFYQVRSNRVYRWQKEYYVESWG